MPRVQGRGLHQTKPGRTVPNYDGPMDAGLVEDLKKVFVSGPSVRFAILFGSHARGTERPDSDVDVAIEPADGGLGLDEEMELIGLLERAVSKSVDLVRVGDLKAGVRWRVARDGIVLVSNPPWAASRFLARCGIEHDENLDLEAEASRRFRARLLAAGSTD